VGTPAAKSISKREFIPRANVLTSRALKLTTFALADPMQNPSSIVPTQDITNTKFAAIAIVLGLKLQKPGIYVTLDKEHPQSSGGQAHFLFETNLQNSVRSYLEIFNAGTADAELEDYLSKLDMPPAQLAALELKIAQALIVYGRKFLDQHQIVVRYVKDEVHRFVVTGGEPVLDAKGQVAGQQNFSITQLKKESK
jgi:hypothetical protein